uniref:Uncharacterized protein n=1 Tax=Somion occarium TaxID=3059160 RepID=A0ABP1D339_9APHY
MRALGLSSAYRTLLTCSPHPSGKRFNSSSGQKPVSHAQVYTDLIPGMVPIALLGSAVYLGLRLWQTSLAQEKYLDEARSRVAALEAELDSLRKQPKIIAEDGDPITQPGTSKRLWFF